MGIDGVMGYLRNGDDVKCHSFGPVDPTLGAANVPLDTRQGSYLVTQLCRV